MNENYDLRKFGADKIVFLGMFLLAVLIANFIVSVNSALYFSEPIELAHTGLSISIPAGKGWQNSKQWRYEDNAFILSSNFLPDGHSPDAVVNCRYLLSSQQGITPKNLLKQQTNDPNNIILETKLIQKGNIEIHWAHIEKPFSIFWGAAELPNNRTVTIEVFETTFEIDIGERIFTKIVESMSFNEDNPVKTGEAFVNEIKSKGIDSLINNYNSQSCFFIQDSDNRNIGCTIDLLGKIDSNDQFGISGASYLFMGGLNPQEQKTLFRGDKGLNKYIWQSQTITRTLQKGAIIALDESGTINVTTQVNVKPDKYLNCSRVVPSILLESLINPIIQSDINDAVIDIIDSNGKISSALFSFQPADENAEGYFYIVTLESLDGRGFSETFYLNDDKQIIRAAGNYYLERTDIETIKEEFPNLTDYISQHIQLFNTNSL